MQAPDQCARRTTKAGGPRWRAERLKTGPSQSVGRSAGRRAPGVTSCARSTPRFTVSHLPCQSQCLQRGEVRFVTDRASHNASGRCNLISNAVRLTIEPSSLRSSRLPRNYAIVASLPGRFANLWASLRRPSNAGTSRNSMICAACLVPRSYGIRLAMGRPACRTPADALSLSGGSPP
jgi:hypothetical protein